jgi:hypothetical protein
VKAHADPHAANTIKHDSYNDGRPTPKEKRCNGGPVKKDHEHDRRPVDVGFPDVKGFAAFHSHSQTPPADFFE